MAEINYYEFLRLSVEKFENDIPTLEKAAEKIITELISSSSVSKTKEADIHRQPLNQAIHNPVLWERYYKEYKKNVDEKIDNSLLMCAEDGVEKRVPAEDITSISDSCNVSKAYVEGRAKQSGYAIGKNVVDNTSKDTKVSLDELMNSIAPDIRIRNELGSIHNALSKLGMDSLKEFIEKQNNVVCNLSACSKNEVLNVIGKVKKYWANKPRNGPQAQEKSYYDKICIGFIEFFKKSEMDDYIRYLNWKSINDMLNSIYSRMVSLKGTDSLTLNKSYFNLEVDNIYSIINDREKAKAILEAYCDSKGISYPKAAPNLSVCPFCSNSFEKKDPPPDKCPLCNRSLKVNCPKCGTAKNLLVTNECDGVNLLEYPHIEKQLVKLETMLDTLDYDLVCMKLDSIEKKWPKFPGTAELRSKCRSIESSYGADIKQMRQLCGNNKYYAAKLICDRIGTSYPAFKSAYSGIYETLSRADSMYNEAMAEKDSEKRIQMLLELLTLVEDHPEANAKLKSSGVEALTDFRAERRDSSIALSWRSGNKPNTVQFCVRRSRTPISAPSDGAEIGVTQSTWFTDTTPEEGQAYYYAVYAKRGPVVSPIAILKEAVVVLSKPDVTVTPKNCGVSVSWKQTNAEIDVYISESPMSSVSQGRRCSNVVPTGVDIEGLNNGNVYYLAVCKHIKHMGKEYSSEVVFRNFTPIENITAPEITSRLGTENGEYIIIHTNPDSRNNVEFYWSETKASITPGTVMSISELRQKLRKMDVTPAGNNEYSMMMGKHTEIYVYPVICCNDTAVVGCYNCMRYAKPVKITKAVVSGNKLCIYIDKWVDGADAIMICYSESEFPKEINDADRRMTIVRGEYERTKLLSIQSIDNIKYHITLFARKSGTYLPVCNYLFDNSEVVSNVIEYSFSTNIFGAVSIQFESQASMLPEISVCVNSQCVPLSKNGGNIIHVIPAGTFANSIVKIPKYVAKGTVYGRLFTDDSSFNLKLKSGDGRVR